MEFILTLLIICILLGWVFMRLFPILLSWFIKRKIQNGGGTYWGGFNAKGPTVEEEVRRSKENEGKVTVVKMEEKEKVIEENVGEYVDFEEEK